MPDNPKKKLTPEEFFASMGVKNMREYHEKYVLPHCIHRREWETPEIYEKSRIPWFVELFFCGTEEDNKKIKEKRQRNRGTLRRD